MCGYSNVRTYPHAILAARFHSGGNVDFLGPVKYELKQTGIERVCRGNQAVATLGYCSGHGVGPGRRI